MPPSLASDSATAHARHPKPPLTAMASTPGLEVPGGYPRTSAVFAGNKWDHSNENASGEGLLAAAKTYLPAGAKAKKFLPEAVAGYFPSTSGGPSPAHSSKSGATVHTPYPPRYPLTPDVTTPTTDDGDFSTRAYAGSSSGMPTPTPGDFPPVPSSSSSPDASSGYFPQVSAPATPAPEHEDGQASEEGEATETRATKQADVAPLPSFAPLPSVAPFATLLAPMHVKPPPPSNTPPSAATTSPASAPASGSDTSASTPSSASTAPTSPASSSFKKSPGLGSGLARWASVSLRGKRASAPPLSNPPSAFVSPGSKAAERASLDGAPSASPASTSPVAAAPPTYKSTPMSTDPAPKPKRRASLLRTLRGEAKVLSGRVRRDPGRVEEGRRMLSEA